MNQTGGKRIIVDSGVPISIVSAGWLRKLREVTIPIGIRVGNEDFIRKNIAMSVIDREEELFLCGLKTLGD